MPRVTAVMLAWGDEPLLVDAVQAVLASEGAEVDVVLVDNGCTSDALLKLEGEPGVTLLRPGKNLGFAGGCNLGARQATGEFVAFVNGDALVTPTALSRLTAALVPGVALATASLRLYAEPDIMNSAGNPVHFTGLSWAGGLGRPSADYEVRRDVASASGAATVCRAEMFEQLGGFCDTMFAYCEDTDLSLRAWQRGWRVVYVPDAVVLHHYEFSRNPEKLYLLERNRMFMVLTVFGPALLAWALLPLVLLELATTAIALRDGWARQKFRAWLWLARNARLIAGRRRIVRAARVMPDGAFARILTGDLDPGVPGLAVPRLVQTGSRSYWNLARRFM